MKVLVTGASGFLGSHLVPELRARGHAVVALQRDGGVAPARGGGTSVARGDVLDAGSIERAAAGCDAMIHAAGLVSRRREDAERLHRLHVGGTRNAIEAAYRAGVRRVVHVSTSGTVAVSEDPGHVATEEDPTPLGLISRWPYYRTKLFAEQTAIELGAELPALEVVVVNPTLLLGPGDVRGSSTDDVRRFLDRRIPAVPPGGLSFVDVRDAAEATVTALLRGEAGRRYLLGACNLTMRAFFGKLERASGILAPRLDLPRVRGLDRVLSAVASRLEKAIGTASLDPVSLEMAFCTWYLDASRAERELDFHPRDPMDTLLDTVEDLRGRHSASGVSPWSGSIDEVTS